MPQVWGSVEGWRRWDLLGLEGVIGVKKYFRV